MVTSFSVFLNVNLISKAVVEASIGYSFTQKHLNTKNGNVLLTLSAVSASTNLYIILTVAAEVDQCMGGSILVKLTENN